MSPTAPTAPSTPRAPRAPRTVVAVLGAGALILLAALTGAAPAQAATPGEATGPTGQKLTVSNTRGVDPDGEKVTVTGTGYDPAKGVYLAVCEIQGRGEAPSPCLGGVDMSGGSGSQYWISNNPPAYAKDIVKPFTVTGGLGGFTLELTVRAKDSGADCSQKACAVVTRADHTHGADREQDVIVPVEFGAGAGPGPEVAPGTVRHSEIRRITAPSGGNQAVAVDSAARRIHVSSGDLDEYRLTTYDSVTGAMVGDPVPLPSAATTMEFDPATGFLYLALSDRIATYDTRGGGLEDHRTPEGMTGIQHIALDPVARRLHVASQNRTVRVFDVKAAQRAGKWPQVGTTVTLPAPPRGLAVDPVTNRGYVTYIRSAMVGGSVSIQNVLTTVDGATGEVAADLTLGTGGLGSTGVTVDPTTATAYVAQIGANAVSVVDLRKNEVTGSIAVEGNPRVLAVDPETRTLYAAQSLTQAIAVIDLRRAEVVQSLPAGDYPDGLTVDGSYHTLYAIAESKALQIQRQVSPTVTGRPQDTSVAVREKAQFRALASADPEPAVSWEVSSDQGRSWRTVAGATEATLTFEATAEHHGNRYRAVFSNPVGSTRTDTAELTVTTPATEPPTTAPPTDPATEPPTEPEPTDPGPEPEPEPSADPGPDPTQGANGTGGTGGTSGSGGTVGGSTGGSTGSAGSTGSTGSATGSLTSSTTGGLAATGSGALPYVCGALALTGLGAAAVLVTLRGSTRRRLAQAIGMGRSPRA
ncbi:endoglucanase [Streptomyces uncialis]|uniref:endoglucanase n=1 Tax=Streptomyces uncialis TaxID=1048205 RepID=UPI0015C046F0|nr:endoglucanase [Streptomyces uncialis]